MKNWQKIFLFTMLAAMSISLISCGSESNDVPSLGATPTAGVGSDSILDDEAKMMAFTECLRGEGLEIMDPMVDPDGNVEKPEIAEGFEASKKEFEAAFEVCEEIIEGITFGKEKEDLSDQVDFYLDLAACLREEGYDIDDPTAETLDTWMTEFKTVIDWDDPEMMETYETCSGSEGGAGEGKGK
jgi:hypothetical protein